LQVERDGLTKFNASSVSITANVGANLVVERRWMGWRLVWIELPDQAQN